MLNVKYLIAIDTLRLPIRYLPQQGSTCGITDVLDENSSFFFGGVSWVVCPAHSRMFSCIPGLYPLDASSTPTPTPQELRQRNLSPNSAKYPSKVKSAPVESH